VTWRNDLNPDWDEVIYVPVHTSRELITCEVMDEESGINRDRLLGHFSIDLREYVHQNRETGEYEEHDEKKVINQQLFMGPGRPTKGIVQYTCSFFPAIPVIDPEEEEREEEAAKEMEAKEASVNGDVAGRLSVGSKRSSLETPRKSAEYPTPTKPQAKGNISSGKTSSPNASSVNLTYKQADTEKEREESDQGEIEVPKIRLNKENLMDYGMHFKW
jgi:hypothetical protein